MVILLFEGSLLIVFLSWKCIFRVLLFRISCFKMDTQNEIEQFI